MFIVAKRNFQSVFKASCQGRNASTKKMVLFLSIMTKIKGMDVGKVSTVLGLNLFAAGVSSQLSRVRV